MDKFDLLPYTKTDDVLKDSRQIIEAAQKKAYQTVNILLVERNWLLGKRISEEFMSGSSQDRYGKQIIADLSKKLTKLYGKGFDRVSIYRYVKFFQTFPEIVSTLSTQSSSLSWSHYSRKSYTTNNQKGTVAIIDNKCIKLPKIGKVKAVIHRVPDDSWTIKSATVSQESDGKYYISVLFEFENIVNPYVADKTNAIGLDYASDGLYVDSNGNTGTNHKYYRESHDKLAKAQRKLSRMQGSKKYEVKSNNYIKQLRKVNKIHRHIANQRLDNLHKISTKIANSYDVVCVESLDMKAMSNHGFGNGKATLDNGYGMFLSMLEYKLSDRNKYLIKVDKWFPSSQICHCCGMLHPEMKNLAIRKMTCDCGLTISRDQNAAINILREGLRLLTEVA